MLTKSALENRQVKMRRRWHRQRLRAKREARAQRAAEQREFEILVRHSGEEEPNFSEQELDILCGGKMRPMQPDDWKPLLSSWSFDESGKRR